MQHHIARGLAIENLPQVAVLEIAEAIGAADWKDRGLDVATEIEQRFAGLGTEQHSPARDRRVAAAQQGLGH